jgi:CheY-like chemotaxis protein
MQGTSRHNFGGAAAAPPSNDSVGFQTNLLALNATERTGVGDACAAVAVRERLSARGRFRYCTAMWSRYAVVVSLFRRSAAVRKLNSRWRTQEAIGEVTHQLLKTGFSQPLQTIMARLIQEGHWEGELTQVRRDGSLVSARTRHIPVVALTASAMVGDAGKALAAVCHCYITKPIDTRALPPQLAKFQPPQHGERG